MKGFIEIEVKPYSLEAKAIDLRGAVLIQPSDFVFYSLRDAFAMIIGRTDKMSLLALLPKT